MPFRPALARAASTADAAFMCSRSEYLPRFPVELAMASPRPFAAGTAPGVRVLPGLSGEAAALGALAYG